MLLQEFMKAIMCFMVEFWDIERRPQPPIKPHSEPYIDFEWPLQGWCIDLPQVSHCTPSDPPLMPPSISPLSGCCRAGDWTTLRWTHMPCLILFLPTYPEHVSASAALPSQQWKWKRQLCTGVSAMPSELTWALVQNSRICLLRSNTADQMLDVVMPAFPKLGVKIDDVVVANFAMWHNT